MKRLLYIFPFLLASTSVFSQNMTLKNAPIDSKVAQLELNAKIFEKATVDSSKSENPYTETFFLDSKTKKLAKVEYLNLKPYVRMTYYFFADDFIKLMVVDKSTHQIFNIYGYYENGKQIAINYRSIDGDNSGTKSIKKAFEYLHKFNNLKVAN